MALSDVKILIIDDDAASQSALEQVFDSEGWSVSCVSDPNEALGHLAHGFWTIVLANVGLSSPDGTLFTTLKVLAKSEADSGKGKKRLRVLFLVPRAAARWAQPLLERESLPYVLKPLHLHDFLEKVSDLLMEAQAISQPIRNVRTGAPPKERRQKDRRSGRERHKGQMFASREDYIMTEEEIAEYEKQEEESRKKRQPQEKKPEFL
jgi:DNA-binding response OmpR family regulator